MILFPALARQFVLEVEPQGLDPGAHYAEVRQQLLHHTYCAIQLLHCAVLLLYCAILLLYCAIQLLHCAILLLYCAILLLHCAILLLYCYIISYCTV